MRRLARHVVELQKLYSVVAWLATRARRLRQRAPLSCLAEGPLFRGLKGRYGSRAPAGRQTKRTLGAGARPIHLRTAGDRSRVPTRRHACRPLSAAAVTCRSGPTVTDQSEAV